MPAWRAPLFLKGFPKQQSLMNFVAAEISGLTSAHGTRKKVRLRHAGESP